MERGHLSQKERERARAVISQPSPRPGSASRSPASQGQSPAPVAGRSPLRKQSTALSTPSMLHVEGSADLSSREQAIDERIRTLCLVILALAVLAAGAYTLKSILVPFVLALALKYLLTPLIDLLACKETSCPLQGRVPKEKEMGKSWACQG